MVHDRKTIKLITEEKFDADTKN